jgi:hypothetical protein
VFESLQAENNDLRKIIEANTGEIDVVDYLEKKQVASLVVPVERSDY